jgi:type III restriction enzyme
MSEDIANLRPTKRGSLDHEKIVTQIAQRLSLRKPQLESLNCLHAVAEAIEFGKDVDLTSALGQISALYPTVEAFERDFPSLCFTLATGVGKTRLMGAFITYLYLTKKSRNFFVLAPNLVIYDKLIADFQPSSPKYVFRGIDAFANQPPLIVNADNYEEGRGVRGTDLLGQEAVIINIFNVSKINSEVRGGKSPRIKRLQEYIGESYFDYLAGLSDLVLLMDEAHRYRASAGVKAIGELKPVLGLELTATPKGVGSNVEFKNIIYRYDLPQAMADGYVKEPAVGTRANFNEKNVIDEEQLERIKLEDGIHYHEHVKVQLLAYAQKNGVKAIHPFMLVVAADIPHAEEIKAFLESKGFFGGRYAGRIITVHSANQGEQKEKADAALMKLETSTETEVVIHVNSLGEGWDVSNLFTIVPLRRADSQILTEQTLGRGLRLPYGKRTGVEAIDTLTVIAHNRFNEIIEAAKSNRGLIHKAVTIGEGGTVSTRRPVMMTASSAVSVILDDLGSSEDNTHSLQKKPESPLLEFRNRDEQELAKTVYNDILPLYRSKIKTIDALTDIKIVEQITKDALATQQSKDGLLFAGFDEGRATELISTVCTLFVGKTIAVPEIVLLPTDQVSFGFKRFDIDGLHSWRQQPISGELKVQVLRTQEERIVSKASGGNREERLENYIVQYLIDYDEVDYEAHAEMLYDLSGQVVKHLRTYLDDEEDIHNVLQWHGRAWAEIIFNQMQRNMWRTETSFRVSIRSAYSMLKPQGYDAEGSDCYRDLRSPPTHLNEIKRFVFNGISRGCYWLAKFDSDSERQFAVLLEDTPQVEKWMRPSLGQFRIEDRDGHQYQPDFVVETETEKFIIEVKRGSALTEAEVLRKADSARIWCHIASEHHAKPNNDKPWSYILIPDAAINASATLSGLIATYTRPADAFIAERYKIVDVG